MGGRYFITGVQLGMMKAIVEEKDILDLLEEIENKQYLCEKEDEQNN